MDRIQTIMPYLAYEDDPYMVTADGKLYWMVDAYTTSSNYPYAEPFNGKANYIRNSIKVVVDAYNGDVNFYSKVRFSGEVVVHQNDRDYAGASATIYDKDGLKVEVRNGIITHIGH